jgi:MIZ/SP-RING zinc finger
MQQPGNDCLPTRQDLLAAKRLAESNATTNHFLGATQRPWMNASDNPIPNLSVKRKVLQSRPTSDAARGPLDVSSTPTSDSLRHYIRNEQQGQNTERPPLAQEHGISVTAEQPPANYQDSDVARKRPFDAACSELDMRRRSTLQQIQRPGLASLRPSPGAVRTAGALPSSQESAMQQSQKISVSAMHRLNDFQARIGTLSKIEWQRFSVLREACAQNDCFYLCLHQIFCVVFMNPQRTIETGLGEDQYAGLNLLTLILLSNQDLSAEVLKFFADLPAPLETLIGDPFVYRGVFRQVGTFLRHFAAGWDLLREKCFGRKFPPFVDELVDVFEVHSPVLQRVLFNSIHRQVGGTDEATWSNQGLMLFDANQAQYQARKKNYGNGEVRPKAAILAEQEILGEQYKALQKDATKPTCHVFSAEHVVTAGQPSAQTRSLSHNQNPWGAFPSRCASAYLPCDSSLLQSYGHAQWSPAHNPFSRPQSINNLGVRGESRAWQQSTPRESPNLTRHSIPGVTGNSPAPSICHVRQQPPPYQRQGLPPLSNRPGLPQIRTSLAQYRGHGGGSGRGDNLSICHSADQSTTKPTSLVPPSGYIPIRTSHPNPTRLALHQAYLRSPTVEKINAVGRSASETKLYQYLSAFSLQPKFLDCETSLCSWSFSVSAAEISKKAVDTASSDGEPKRLVSDGSILYRLRSVEVVHDSKVIEEADWSVKDTKWPTSCFLRVNEVDIELRRKLHHGKDLPVDLTSHIREGTNNIIIAILSTREQKIAKEYALAVEMVEIGDQNRVDSAPTMLSANESLRSITQGLAESSNAAPDGDDEVQVVDLQISVDLIDPFMATIFHIPARGKACTHRECFDLQTFFQTRRSAVNNGPTSPDEWKCPICNKDARPQSLIVDCFLKTVRDSLVASDATAHARAIFIGSDGSWNVKKEDENKITTRENSNATVVDSPARSKETVAGKVSRSESVVIDLDND